MPAPHSFAQSNPEPTYFGYSKELQRVHLKFVSSYVFFRMRRSMDADSAAILAADAEKLPYSLYYDEDYADGPEGNIKQLLTEGNSYVFKSGTAGKDLDRALSILTKAQEEATKSGNAFWQHASLASLGKLHVQRRDAEASARSFNEALDVARKTNDPVMLRRALVNRGVNTAFGNPQKELDFQESLKIAQQQRDTVSEVEIRTLIYQIYFVQRKLDTVKTQLLFVTDLEKKIGYKHLHYNYDVLAFVDNNSALGSVFENCRKAIESVEATGDYAFSNFIYATMAEFYIDFEDWEHAMEWIKKSFQQEYQNKAKRLWYSQFSTVMENLAKQGRVRDALNVLNNVTKEYPPVTAYQKWHMAHVKAYCYHRMNKRDSSEMYFTTMLTYLDSVQHESDNSHLYTGHLDLARFYLVGGKPEIARRHFETAKRYGRFDDVYRIVAIHRFQAKLDSVNGDFFHAFQEYKAGQLLWDSIYTVTKNKQLTELQISYEVAAKDKDIELLTARDKMQQATLERSTLEKRLILAGILVLFVITALIYRQYWNKQRTSKEMQDKNLTLERLVKDKEWLVKEIHHRVKNNLQIIISLLRTQAAHLKEGDALSAINESQSRMQVISLLHQKLYKGVTDSSIDMKMYVPDLVTCIREGIDSHGRIKYVVDVDEIKLDISQAVPVGLILNEAITNAVKYAYPEGQRGSVRVYMKTNGHNKILIGVSDNGRGLPENFDYRVVTSMGMKLIETLADQLAGVMNLQGKGGTTLEIAFAREESR